MKGKPTAPKTVVAIRHVGFEGLGTFEAVFTAAGYRIHYYDIGINELSMLDPLQPTILVVLGGPIGVYDAMTYPFLEVERRIVLDRVQANLPTLGICLGAQIIAWSLGGKVVPMPTKEIGFSEVELTSAGLDGPLRHLENVPVLHWHGDGIELPPGAVNLASSSVWPVQAFAIGKSILGIQFHPEVNACAGLEQWLVGHAAELAAAGINPAVLRQQAPQYGPLLRERARMLLDEWLKNLPQT